MSTASERESRRDVIWFAAASFVVVGIASWPWLARFGTALADPGSLNDVSAAADARLLAWVLAWNAHAAWTQPLHWFDANIFHPARNMLAGSESLLGLLPLSLPVSALARDAVLAANVTTWLTYPAAAIAMYAYLRRASLTPVACAVGALLFCFGPYRLPADIRVLQLPCFFLPLLALAVQASRPGRRVWLPVVALLALTSSLYMAAMSGIVLVVELAFALRTRGVRETAWLVVSLLPIVPLLVIAQRPYVEQAATMPATLDPLLRADVVAAATWGALAAGTVAWRSSVLVACALGLVGLLAPLRRRSPLDPSWWRALAYVVIGTLIAAGPTLHVFGMDLPLPVRLFSGTPLAALRAFPRFLVLASLGVCSFAAAGAAGLVAAVRSRAPSRALAPAVTLGLLLVATVPGALAMLSSPLSDVDLAAHPDVDRILAASDGAVLEIPPPLPGPFSSVPTCRRTSCFAARVTGVRWSMATPGTRRGGTQH
ncbi:hypothetical protein K2Z84_20280 [Candidatus Binatia bacterium]|jgi:hypothetical protein|nr:hypothetical protein [Candidatus Binatia bacterium]